MRFMRKLFFKGDTPKRKHSIMEIVSDYLLHSGEVTTIELLCGEEYLNGIVVEDDLFGLKLEVYTDEGSSDGVAWIKKRGYHRNSLWWEI